MKKNANRSRKIVTLMSILVFFLAGMALADKYLIFKSTRIRCFCGQSGRTVNIKLTAEAAVNDDYAVQLGWTLDTLANKRKTEVEHNTRVTGLDDNPPHDGTGDGYNVSGFNLVIYRDQQAGGGYHYREEVELDISGSVPCFHYDAE